MGIHLTLEQVLTMAPDASSASAGKKLANEKHWKNLGQNADALWGECQGSALYQVRVEISSLAVQCSCPSRKLPCKHGLGLLLIAVNTPAALPQSKAPEWVVSWLTKRAAATKRKETVKESGETKANQPPSAAQLKTAEKRIAQVTQGIEQLDLWLNDLVRNGLGNLGTQPAKFWEEQAQRMVDAQAPALATRIRKLAALPHSTPDWPEKLLDRLGQLALLSQAFSRLPHLDPALQEDVKQLLGWSLKEDEVLLRGERVRDDWLILGQVVEDGDRTRMQRTWLLGATTKRTAYILQFALSGSAFEKSYPLGTRQQGDLVFWPGAEAQRALIEHRHGDMHPLTDLSTGMSTIEQFCATIAAAKARQPWQDCFLCTLHNVTPVRSIVDNSWYIRDRDGYALPLVRGEHWQFLALSGGLPVDFAAEWNGEVLTPLCVLAEGVYCKL